MTAADPAPKLPSSRRESADGEPGLAEYTRSTWSGVLTQGQIFKVQFQVPDDRVAQPDTARGCRRDPVPGPPLAEFLAAYREFADEVIGPGVVGMPANVRAQGPDSFGRDSRPVAEEPARTRIEDDPPGQVPLRHRHGREVGQQEESQTVSSQHVAAAAQNEGGNVTYGIQELAQSGPHPLHRNGWTLGVRAVLQEVDHVGLFAWVQAQGPRH